MEEREEGGVSKFGSSSSGQAIVKWITPLASARSSRLHLDRFGDRLLRFRQMDAQDPIFEFGRDFSLIGIIGQREASLEGAVRALDPVKFLPFLFFLLPVFSLNGENPFFDRSEAINLTAS